MRRMILILGLGLAAAGAHAQATDAARKLAQEALIVDTHIDAPDMLLEGWRDLTTRTDRDFDWPKARAGGLDIAFMSIYTSPRQDAADTAFHAANQQIDAVWALAARAPDKFAVLSSPSDIRRLSRPGRVLLPLGMENGAPIGDAGTGELLASFRVEAGWLDSAGELAWKIADELGEIPTELAR